jgi:hypothetical protein
MNEQPPTAAEVDRDVVRLQRYRMTTRDAELHRLVRVRLERIGRLKFHVAAWCWG